MRKFILLLSMLSIVILSVLILSVVGCEPSTESNFPAARRFTTTTEFVTDYGNGVLFFLGSGKEFGTRLSGYMRANHVSVTSISAESFDNNSEYNSTDGYWVIVKSDTIK